MSQDEMAQTSFASLDGGFPGPTGLAFFETPASPGISRGRLESGFSANYRAATGILPGRNRKGLGVCEYVCKCANAITYPRVYGEQESHPAETCT